MSDPSQQRVRPLLLPRPGTPSRASRSPPAAAASSLAFPPTPRPQRSLARASTGRRPQTPEAHVFKADVPGLKEEEVKVEVEDGNVLQITGERSKEQEEKNDKWHRVERSSGKFMRRFRLPENAKTEQISASMENGVLTVTVPRAEVKKPDVKSVQITG